MKKTLIALAALAATGTAFAQSSVTISGKFGVSVVKDQIGTAGKKGETNTAVTDGDVRFSGVEDIGGGLKADFSMELRVRGRRDVNEGAAGVGGRNATLGLAHKDFGKVTLGSIEIGNGIKARGWAGAPISISYALESGGQDGLLGRHANADILQYTSPELIKGLTVTALRADSIGSPTEGTNTSSYTAGRGAASNTLGVSYSDGPISAGADYTMFNKAASGTNATKEASRIRASASYDLGVAVIGAGIEKGEDFTGTSTANGKLLNAANYTVGVKVPLGAFTLGGAYAKTNAKKADVTDKALAGYVLGAQYDFSKRTNVNYSLLNQTEAANSAQKGTYHQLRVMHSF
jgi:predicted porin